MIEEIELTKNYVTKSWPNRNFHTQLDEQRAKNKGITDLERKAVTGGGGWIYSTYILALDSVVYIL